MKPPPESPDPLPPPVYSCCRQEKCVCVAWDLYFLFAAILFISLVLGWGLMEQWNLAP